MRRIPLGILLKGVIITTYKLCKKLIALGRTEGLKDKLDVYLAADRITAEEYEELMGMLTEEV